MDLNIILGSSSKWRKRELEKMTGLSNIKCIYPDIDEKKIRHDDPKVLTLKIAHSKLQALLPQLDNNSIVICSDQVIECNGKIREKPENEEEARQFLKSYGTYPAKAYCAVVVMNTKTGKIYDGVEVATQYFKEIPDDVIDRLIKQGDVMKCCGGFTIEHMEEYLGELEGEVETIMGMPKTLTLNLINQARLSK